MATYTTNPYKNINPISGGGKDVYNKEYAKASQAAQSAQEAAIAQAQSNIARTNNELINKYNATKNGAGLALGAGLATGALLTPNASQIKNSVGDNGATGVGVVSGNVAASQTASNPYADLYSIYEQQLNAQKAAAEQQRQARLGALQSNYANAKNQLSSAFDSGENQINTDADKALRDSYVNMMLNQKRLNQQLESQGINGGAMESSLARAYNEYGNSRNNIEQGRLDNIGQLLREYQNSLGDVENNYQNNLANLDADYSGNIANAVSNYYDTIAKLQAQNAASSLKNALGKSGSSSTKSSSTEDSSNGLNKDIVNGLKNYKGNLAAARAYLTYMGVPEQTQNDYLMNGGFGADLMDDGSLTSYGIAPQQKASNVSPAVRNTIINNLKRIYPTTSKDGLSANESLYRNVINQLNQYAQQYGLSDAEAQAILAEAGF